MEGIVFRKLGVLRSSWGRHELCLALVTLRNKLGLKLFNFCVSCAVHSSG